MIKKVIFAICLFAMHFAQAQQSKVDEIVLTMPLLPWESITYDITIKQDTVAHSSQGDWDFSSVTTDTVGTIEFEPISLTSFTSTYPNATHIKHEGGDMFFLGFETNQYTFHGEMSVITTSYTNPLVIQPYPLAVGDVHTDSESDISFTCNGCPPAMERDDAVYTESISTGQLTMPDNTVHSTATLVYNTRTWNDGQIGSPTCNLFLEQWQWWVSGYPLPVAQTIELSTTGPCPPGVGYRQSKFLVGDPMNPPTSVDDLATSNIIAYPNPVQDKLYLSARNSTDIYYAIQDLKGSTYIEGTLSNSDEAIDVASLTQGIYVVKIFGDKEHYLQFVKQ